MNKEQAKQFWAEERKEERARLARLITLGKEGKLWRIEFCYRYEVNSVGRFTQVNLEAAELMKLRETMFSHGFLMPVKDDPGHWIIVQPKDILTVEVWRQGNYFDK